MINNPGVTINNPTVMTRTAKVTTKTVQNYFHDRRTASSASNERLKKSFLSLNQLSSSDYMISEESSIPKLSWDINKQSSSDSHTSNIRSKTRSWELNSKTHTSNTYPHSYSPVTQTDTESQTLRNIYPSLDSSSMIQRDTKSQSLTDRLNRSLVSWSQVFNSLTIDRLTPRFQITSHKGLNTLTIHNVTEADFGDYVCLATNSLGSANRTLKLTGEPIMCFDFLKI